MVQLIPWVERSWKFDVPLRQFPNIVERLRGTPARLEKRLGALSRDTLVRRQGDKWSLQEQAGHLLDLDVLDKARLEDFINGRERLTAADMTNRRTMEAAHNDRAIDDLLTDFARARGELVARLDEVDEAFIGRVALHPRLAVPVRVVDWTLFVAEHDDHHLAVITSMLRRAH
jgi:hypothetical protein